MNEIVDSGYDHKTQMRKLRAARKSLGLSEPTVLMFTDEVEWWRGQMALSAASRLSSRIARDPSAAEQVAELHVKVRAKLVDAMALKEKAPENLHPLIEDYRQALLTQQLHNREGTEALEARSTSAMMKAYALEYVAALRAKGYRHLIRYYMEGGNRPRVLDDV